jgi:CBS domain-containing protein
MTTAREIMSTDVAFARREDTVRDVAQKMAQHDVGMLPVCNDERRIDGAITDRDIAVKVVAQGLDPSETKVDEVAERAEVVTIGADDPVDEALETMKRYAVRRLPVIDGNQVVGMVSQADIARSLPERQTGDVVQEISEASPNN